MRTLSTLAIVAIMTLGCASTGSFTVIKPAEQKFDYEKTGLKISLAPGIADKFSIITEDTFIDILDDNTFKSVKKGDAAQTIRVKVLTLDEGDDLKWVTHFGGNSEVTMEVEIIAGGKTIAKLNIYGNSKSGIHTNTSQYYKSAAINAIYEAAKQLDKYFAGIKQQ
jgi:hypothetical protein